MRRAKNRARSATIKSGALGALKPASCARSARRECAREAVRFFWFKLFYINNVGGYFLGKIYNKHLILQNMLQVQKNLQLLQLCQTFIYFKKISFSFK